MEREKFKGVQRSYIKIFVCMLMLILVVNTYAGNISYAADADEASDYSFYMLASNMSAALSTFAADPNDNKAMRIAFEGLYPSAAGGVLGYVDTSVRGVYGLSGTATSNAATSYSYKQLSTGNYGEINGGGTTQVFSTYCALGAGLADLGIDKTSTDAGEDATRMMIGVAIRLFYEASHIVTVLFGFIIKFLKTINPFQFFSAANDWMNSDQERGQAQSLEGRMPPLLNSPLLATFFRLRCVSVLDLVESARCRIAQCKAGKNLPCPIQLHSEAPQKSPVFCDFVMRCVRK